MLIIDINHFQNASGKFYMVRIDSYTFFELISSYLENNIVIWMNVIVQYS